MRFKSIQITDFVIAVLERLVFIHIPSPLPRQLPAAA